MPRGYPPSIFVSSTCYDLSQVRLDLKRFIEALGYDAVISESNAFPVNPQTSTVENCLRAVRDRADILILIVGARYGTVVVDRDRSITNLEYLEAKAKGIPIYVLSPINFSTRYQFGATTKRPTTLMSSIRRACSSSRTTCRRKADAGFTGSTK